jgi:threonine dehydratase
MHDLLESILTAPVYDVAIESPLEPARALSRRLGHEVLLKREDLQPVFSFKLRGAYTKMARLARAQLVKGVVAASAGNHAQGVALAAERLSCRATIVMPRSTPDIKVRAVVARAAEVELHGETYAEAYERARILEAERGLTLVHAYDDLDVIAGQGTIGMELLRQRPRGLDAVFVPVGGGGLIAGIAAYVKRLAPEISVIGVEPVDADAMRRSLAAGRRVRLDEVGLFADGVAVKEVGERTFRVCRELVDDVLLVDSDEVCAAIEDVFEETRSILEPAGALSIAGVKAWARTNRGHPRTLVAIASGANMSFEHLRHVAERAALVRQRAEAHTVSGS